MKKAYVSRLAPYMESFMEFKHSLGWKYETSDYYLHEFDRYYADNEPEGASLKEIIKRWAILRNKECPNTQHVRVAPIREFGKFLLDSLKPTGTKMVPTAQSKRYHASGHFL